MPGFPRLSLRAVASRIGPALLIVALVRPAMAATLASLPGVTLNRSDGSGVSFDVDTSEPVLRASAIAPEFSELTLSSFSAIGDVGEPALPSRILWIGIPAGAQVSLDVTAGETRVYHGVRLLPRVLEDDEAKPITRETLAALAGSAAYRSVRRDAPLARLATITGMRAQRVAGIEIHPARYDPLTGDLEVATKISVQVRFAGKPTASAAPRLDPVFETVYRNLLLNYQAARSFRGAIGLPARGSLRTQRIGAPSAPLGFDIASQWVQVSVDRKGIQEIRGSDVQAAGVDLGGVDPASLRLFTRPGIPLLDEASFCDTCGLSEVAIRVDDGGDGHLDTGDRILFFGLGPSGWRDDYTGPGGAPDEWLDHPYDVRNVYWLTWNAMTADPPRRWTTRDVSPTDASAWQAPSYEARLHFETDAAHVPNSYEPGIFWDQWAWKILSPYAPPFESDIDGRGAVAGTPARLRARFWGLASSSYTPGPDHVLDASFNKTPLSRMAWYGARRWDVDTTLAGLVDGENSFSAQAQLPSGSYFGGSTSFFWWELRFARSFQASADTLEFASADTTGTVGYGVASFSNTDAPGFALLDVSDPLSPVELTGWVASDTTGGRAVYFDDAGGSRFYFAAAMPGRRHPLLERKTPFDPRRGGADYLIICSDDLESAALRLAQHREMDSPPFPGATSAVVRISDILDWYAGGRMDPTAIRNFLHDIVSNGRWSPAPSIVCLLGDASFDFKACFPGTDTALARDQVPTCEHGRFGDQFPSDDWLVDMDAPPPGNLSIPDLIVGRIPAANPTEADDMIDKVVSYDNQPAFGDWRSRVLFIADDLYQGLQPDPLGGTHTQQADSLARDYLPDWLDPEKVFLLEYGFTTGTVKGGAHDELLRQLDRGAVFWHYIGHGSPYQLADEKVITLQDVPSMTNGSRLPVFFAAGCEVAPFDHPIVTGLGEALVKHSGGGTVASFASPALTYAHQNYNLGRALYLAIMTPPELGGARTLGEGAFIAKHRVSVSMNDITYHLLGDPGLRIAVPQADVRIRTRDAVTGTALGDSLPCCHHIRLEAEVHGTRDPATSDLLTSFEGTAVVRVTDAPKLVPFPLIPNLPGSPIQNYEANPRTALEGTFPVHDGRLEAEFVLPAEARPGARARIDVYATNGALDASGARFVEVAPGDTAATTSGKGPTIQIASQSGGTVVGPSEGVIVTLEDPSGIFTLADSTALGIGIAVDQSPDSEVTDRFQYDVGSFSRGTVLYSLSHLSEGLHSVTVSASNNLARDSAPDAYRSHVTATFQVAKLVDTTAMAAFVFPNPFRGPLGTHLVFSGFPQSTVAEVLVFDLSGRLVRHLQASGSGHVQVDWDGRDRGGRSLGSGIYLYRAHLRPEAGGPDHQLDGRLVLLR